MRGDNYLLALTTTTDEITGEIKPLFAFPVQVCKATEDPKNPIEVAAPSGVRRVQQYMDPTTGEVVADADCPRGVFVGDEFREIDSDAIASINAETKITTMVALGTEPLDGIREKYGDRIVGRYFIQNPAKGGSAKAYRLTYEALLKGKTTPAQAIIVKRTKRSKQALGVIYSDPKQECLVMLEVAFAAQIRESDAQLRQPMTAEVEQAQIDMARQVIASLPAGGPVLDGEVDEAVALRDTLVEEAIAGATEFTKPKAVAATVETDNLADMLKASLAAA